MRPGVRKEHLIAHSLWDAEETKKQLPMYQRTLAEKKSISISHATQIAEEIGLATVQHYSSVAFFKIANVIPDELH
jgi:hypothetical protein